MCHAGVGPYTGSFSLVTVTFWKANWYFMQVFPQGCNFQLFYASHTSQLHCTLRFPGHGDQIQSWRAACTGLWSLHLYELYDLSGELQGTQLHRWNLSYLLQTPRTYPQGWKPFSCGPCKAFVKNHWIALNDFNTRVRHRKIKAKSWIWVPNNRS